MFVSYLVFLLTLFTMGFFGSLKISNTKNDLSIKNSLQKDVTFISIVCLFLCLIWVTWCDNDVISMTTPYKLFKLDMY